jgi:hypothetical protein
MPVQRWLFFGRHAVMFLDLCNLSSLAGIRDYSMSTRMLDLWTWTGYGDYLAGRGDGEMLPHDPRRFQKSLLWNLGAFHESQCFDDRDRIYSLLTLTWHTDESWKCEPDYLKSSRELCFDLARGHATSGRYALALLVSATFWRHEGPSEEAWPSWIPDWRQQISCDGFAHERALKTCHFCQPAGRCTERSCSQSLEHVPFLSPDGYSLRIRGRLVSQLPSYPHGTTEGECPELQRDETYLLLGLSEIPLPSRGPGLSGVFIEVPRSVVFILTVVSGDLRRPEAATFRLRTCFDISKDERQGDDVLNLRNIDVQDLRYWRQWSQDVEPAVVVAIV